ncbi:MAG: SGNH/GDSL hydrolase family protein [Planctomycetes bacterium]|nr:SGNH/GDSL hydrolase family protein [Planctomycetota bacterium]
MKATRWARFALLYDLVTVATFVFFLHALFFGGVKLVYLSEPGGHSSAVTLVLAEDEQDALTAEWKEKGTRIARVTGFERPFFALIGLVLVRFLLTLRVAPPEYRARYRTRWGRLKPRLAAVFLVLLLALLGAELWARRVSPEQGSVTVDLIAQGPGNEGAPVLRPGAKVETAGKEYKINSLGFRGEEIPPAGEGGRARRRVFFLGDSFTYGHEVNDPDTFVRRTEAYLRGRGLAVDAINGGMWGYDTKDEVNLLTSRVADVRPDAVVIVFFINDGLPKVELSRMEQKLYRDLALARIFLDAYEAFADEEKFSPEFVNEAYGEGRPEWEECREALVRFLALSREHRFLPLVVVFPLLERLGTNDYEPAHEFLAESFRSLGIEFLDLAPSFQEKDEEDLWVHPRDHHPNPDAHGLAAEAIGPWLDAKLATLAAAPGDSGARTSPTH